MATEQKIVDYIVDQLTQAGTIRAKKMFGEYALYCNEIVVALVCDNQLFVKPTTSGRQLIDDCLESAPYPHAKPHFLIAGDKLENHEWLCELIKVTAHELAKTVKVKAKKNK